MLRRCGEAWMFGGFRGRKLRLDLYCNYSIAKRVNLRYSIYSIAKRVNLRLPRYDSCNKLPGIAFWPNPPKSRWTNADGLIAIQSRVLFKRDWRLNVSRWRGWTLASLTPIRSNTTSVSSESYKKVLNKYITPGWWALAEDGKIRFALPIHVLSRCPMLWVGNSLIN